MIQFEHSIFLWTLLTVVTVVIMYRYYDRLHGNNLAKFHHFLVQKSALKQIKRGALLIGLILFSLAWANPQWGSRLVEKEVTGIDIYIALDLSQSMLAQDVAPSRLERAVKKATNLIEALKGERVGLIYFAGEAYIQTPLTTDYKTAISSLKYAHPSQVGTQGTAIEETITIANRQQKDEAATDKLMLILSDGEDHSASTIQLAEEASEQGLYIYTMPMGSVDGAYIPVDSKSGKGYLKDQEGNLVKTVANRNFLGDLARAGKGLLVDENTPTKEVLTEMRNRIAKIASNSREVLDRQTVGSYFQYFLMPALILIIFGLWPNLNRNHEEVI